MIWTRHVARIGEVRNAYRIFSGNLKERDLLDLGVDERIILE
jgi:hypothetical protein